MALLDEIGSYLQTQGQGTLATDLFLAEMPPSPDDVVCIYEYPGKGPLDTMGGAHLPSSASHRFQVVCRAADDGSTAGYVKAATKAKAIYDKLVIVVETAIGSPAVRMTISALQQPFGTGQDENQRERVTCNYEVMRTYS